jgi:hypothetical protein
MREAVGFGLESALILSLDDLDYRYCSPEPIERESWGMSARQVAESASDAAHRTCNGCDKFAVVFGRGHRHHGNFDESRDDGCWISACGAVKTFLTTMLPTT